MIKKFVKKALPKSISSYLIKKKVQMQLISGYIYDYKRYYKSSATKGNSDEIKLRGHIIKDYHIIEKGLTMPEARLGFGKDKVISLSKECVMYVEKYSNEDPQVNHAISVLLEYRKFHLNRGYSLDSQINSAINDVSSIAESVNLVPSTQIEITRETYFKSINSAFPEFSNSRKSVRNYSSENIPLSIMNSVLELSRNVPSACNRQTAKAYVFTNEEQIQKIFATQNGNRGFGHLANKLIVITSELGVFSHPLERNQAFIDGGMYAMNMLYSLHSHGIAACILNCSNTPEVDRNQRKASGIKESEVFICMISCGYPPDQFSIASSKRYENICVIK